MFRAIPLAFLAFLLGMSELKAQSTGFDEATVKALRTRWTEAMNALRAPGMAVVVVRDDKVILLEALGIRNLDREPVTADTYFYIASCTKPYVATRIVQLAEAGKLDLDAPVKKYLPRFELKDVEKAEKLTVRDLLTHSQGLNSGPAVLLDAYTGEITDDRYYHHLAQARPQGKVAYSNIHFTLAGRIIEKIDGKPWQESLEEHVFKPAGMTRTTGLASRMYGDTDCAVPLEVKGDTWIPTLRKNDQTMHAAGGLGTTAKDLGQWLRVNMRGSMKDGRRLISESNSEQMQTLLVKDPKRNPVAGVEDLGFGLGWRIGTLRGKRFISHGGGYAGTAALVSFLPDERVGVAVVVNASGPAGNLPYLVMLDVYKHLLKVELEDPLEVLSKNAKQFFERQEKAVSEPVKPVGAKELSLPPEKYQGTYVNEHYGTLKVTIREGVVAATLGEMALTVKADGTDKMQVRGGPLSWTPVTFEVVDGSVKSLGLKLNPLSVITFSK